METNTAERVIIIGAGLAGSLLSLVLAKRGYDVQIADIGTDPHTLDVASTPTASMLLSERGLHALDQVGLKERLLPLALPLRGWTIHPLAGPASDLPYAPNQLLYALSKDELTKQILKIAQTEGAVSCYFNTRCTDMDFGSRHISLRHETSKQTWATPVSRVIGCGGMGSPIRISMLKLHTFKYAPTFLEYGYKQMTLPASLGEDLPLASDRLHFWPREGFFMTALPNPDGRFRCTLVLPNTGEISFETLSTEPAIHTFFETHFPDLIHHNPNGVDDFLEQPNGSLWDFQCTPWHVEDVALLLGDAAHATLPFFVLGLNTAFEDCVALDAGLEHDPGDWQRTFRRFEQKRKPQTDALSELAREHFATLCNAGTDPTFILRHRLAQELANRHPNVFIPRYEMLAFHQIPYTEVKARVALQDRILNRLLKRTQTLKRIKWKRADRLIQETLTPLEGL